MGTGAHHKQASKSVWLDLYLPVILEVKPDAKSKADAGVATSSMYAEQSDRCNVL